MRYTLLITLALLLIGTPIADADETNGIEKIEMQMFGYVSNADAFQIRRLLKPYVDPKNVKFKDYIDAHGRKHHHTTIVEITPRSDRRVHIYRIMRQLKDQRFRGRGAVSQSWIVKTEATVSGEMFAHFGWARSYIRNVPFWRHWRPETSILHHAFVTDRFGQKLVFSKNDHFDLLKLEASKGDHKIRMSGVIAGFDGPYPIFSVRKFQVKYEE